VSAAPKIPDQETISLIDTKSARNTVELKEDENQIRKNSGDFISLTAHSCITTQSAALTFTPKKKISLPFFPHCRVPEQLLSGIFNLQRNPA